MIELPTIRLPSFNGNYNEWIKFDDSFLCLIHQNDVQRFHCLSSTLHCPAARVIQTLGISETNNKIAWVTLRARYDNSSALRRHYLNAFIDSHTPTFATLYKKIHRSFQQSALKSLRKPVECGKWKCTKNKHFYFCTNFIRRWSIRDWHSSLPIFQLLQYISDGFSNTCLCIQERVACYHKSTGTAW